MAISDSNPERRNLVVTSMAFIIFFAAGGYLTDHTIRLEVVNVSFRYPEVLVILAWIMLFWFALRFWQSTKSKFLESFARELKDNPVVGPLRAFAKKEAARLAVEKKGDPSATIEPSGLWRESNRWIIHCSFVGIENGHRVQRHSEVVELRGWRLRWYMFWAFTRHAVVDNAAADYLFPYVLFLAAVASPWWSECL